MLETRGVSERPLGLGSLPWLIRAPAGGSVELLVTLLEQEPERLHELLLRHGALLFRGFGVAEPADLARLVAAAHGTTMRYVGGISPRQTVRGDVYTSTELPPRVRIPLHSELSYLAAYPRHLWFTCLLPADEGGETVIADARRVYLGIDPGVRRRFDALGVRYRCSFHGDSPFFALLERFQRMTRSWMETFESSDRAVVEERCRALGASWRWLPSGRLVLDILRPAAIDHPETGERAWFNSAHLFRLNPRYLGRLNYRLSQLVFLRPETRTHDARYGDGSDIDPATIEHLFDVLDAETVAFPWQRGDVLWLDNRLCMHGRNPFRGRRRVLTAMTR
jgi:alpha-ketoglutarate-dependent taurine dioxygenase